LSLIEAVEKIAAFQGVVTVARDLTDLRERVEQGRLQIAVAGQFKRGKTSVLNALLGSDLLPTGALPFTSVLTMVKFGVRLSAEVILQSGGRVDISVSEIIDYVTEAGNPRNEKAVVRVEVSCPAECLRDGVVYVNCPGFGSPSDQNTRAAYDFVEHADAVVFVTSPDPPLTKAETDFLRRLAEHTRNIFVVMDKIDMVEPGSLPGLLAFTRRSVSEAIRRDPVVYAISARQILAGTCDQGLEDQELGFGRLQADLHRFSALERNDATRASVRHGVLHSIADLQEQLRGRIASTLTASQDFKRKCSDVEDLLSRAHQLHHRIEEALVEKVHHLTGLAERETVEFASARIGSFRSRLGAFARTGSPLSNREWTALLDVTVGAKLQSVIEDWRSGFAVSFAEAIQDACTKFCEATGNVVTYAVQSSAGTLPAPLPGIPELVGEIPTFDAGAIGAGFSWTTQLSLAVFLPQALYRRWILRATLKAIPSRLNQAGRDAAQELIARALANVDSLAARSRTRMQEAAHTVRAQIAEAIAREELSEIVDRERLRHLDESIDELDQLANVLSMRVR
jgi:GTP-binding protein EngB required for normal cell division